MAKPLNISGDQVQPEDVKVCPECGAVTVPARACQEIFDEFLALEFSDPNFGVVHFLTVACFMIQHRRYSDEGLHWIAGKLRDHLEKGISVENIRRQANRDASRDNRRWKAGRASNERQLPVIDWRMRICDVNFPSGDATIYCEEITHWARLTLEDMQCWLTEDCES
jgi:hypothetical protein